jgi:hypothetical protein
MKPELIAAMQAAHDAGLSTFPLGANKRPAIREWAWLMERQPELDQLLIWQASDYSGYAVVMGGPERLLAIDLEAAFVAEHMIEFAQRLMDAECYATWINWMEGLSVATPSGGLHVVIHLMGNDPMPGNEKLASDSSGHCLAETRGQGGYIVGYGSNGNVHPSGKPWIPASGGYDSICWAETEEWAAVKAVLVSFDEAPPVPAPAPPAARPGPGGVTLGELERSSSWIERIEMPDPRPLGHDQRQRASDHVVLERPDPDVGESADDVRRRRRDRLQRGRVAPRRAAALASGALRNTSATRRVVPTRRVLVSNAVPAACARRRSVGFHPDLAGSGVDGGEDDLRRDDPVEHPHRGAGDVRLHRADGRRLGVGQDVGPFGRSGAAAAVAVRH